MFLCVCVIQGQIYVGPISTGFCASTFGAVGNRHEKLCWFSFIFSSHHCETLTIVHNEFAETQEPKKPHSLAFPENLRSSQSLRRNATSSAPPLISGCQNMAQV
ncbi:hypothetical protein DVH24_026491 [Malus domestica]|uniref:Uncharacterized protein n=1 Tax=Malus domestica TaxID=3750 RepID=A0A498KNT2_MALDO|nr:hypothetical protein DVH24_026491 [Malus domestica]